MLTLHDIIFLEEQTSRNKSTYQNLGRIYRRWTVPRILSRCRRIITVSDFERARIGTTLGLAPERLTTVYNGYSAHFHPVADHAATTRRYLPEDRYLLFLGNTDPKKNTARTLRAYALYARECPEPLPLLVADLGENIVSELLAENGISDIRPLLRLPGYIPNTDLPAVYSGAVAFLYTSLRESFGIPILEAMACDTPVISSNTSAIPEVAGDGALLVDPTDERAIAGQIAALAADSKLRDQQIAYGRERITRFSWERTARQTLDIYRAVLG